VLVELSVMEQRYEAVMAVVQDGWKVTEVAQRLGVARLPLSSAPSDEGRPDWQPRIHVRRPRRVCSSSC